MEASQNPSVDVAIESVPVRLEQNFGWQDVAQGISSGSWAVVLTCAVIFWFLRKPVGSYFSKQIEAMDHLLANFDANTATLKELTITLKETRDKHESQNQKILDILDDIYDEVKKP